MGGGPAYARLSLAITTERGVIRLLEDDAAIGFRRASARAHIWNMRAATKTFHPFVEAQLEDKQSGGARDEASGRLKY